MSKVAALFPGQGSQAQGMSLSFYHSFDYVRHLFQEASDCLGYDCYRLIADNPDNKLNQTQYTQPALLLASFVTHQVAVREFEFQADYVAGHSLGEFTALVVAKIFSFGDALRLVAKRGELMQSAVPSGVGAMAAIIGLEEDALEKLCVVTSARVGYVTCANFNSPGQTVVSGEAKAVHALTISAKEAGAKLAKTLPVSVPSHCDLMQDAAFAFSKFLDETNFGLSMTPIVNNVDANLHTEPDIIKSLLIKQLYSPVYWTQSIQRLIAEGVTLAVEFGPSKVLSGLNKRISKDLSSFSLETIADLEKFQEVIA